jgi:hypothetical protein
MEMEIENMKIKKETKGEEGAAAEHFWSFWSHLQRKKRIKKKRE